jgi:nickel transport protein
VKGILTAAVLLAATGSCFAHGARIAWEMEADEVIIKASFDDGSPMDSAQVIIFSGADPMNPWLTSVTDSNGGFSFSPDPDISLNWDVQVRMAGHGDIVHINLDHGEVDTSVHGGFSAMQIVIMSICVVWGFTGTALFFASRRKRN